MQFHCSICLEDLGDGDGGRVSQGNNGEGVVEHIPIAALPCGHVFHTECIQQWKQKQALYGANGFHCPYCQRGVFNGGSLLTLFLTQSTEEGEDTRKQQQKLQNDVSQLTLKLKGAENEIKDQQKQLEQKKNENMNLKVLNATLKARLGAKQDDQKGPQQEKSPFRKKFESLALQTENRDMPSFLFKSTNKSSSGGAVGNASVNILNCCTRPRLVTSTETALPPRLVTSTETALPPRFDDSCYLLKRPVVPTLGQSTSTSSKSGGNEFFETMKFCTSTRPRLPASTETTSTGRVPPSMHPRFIGGVSGSLNDSDILPPSMITVTGISPRTVNRTATRSFKTTSLEQLQRLAAKRTAVPSFPTPISSKAKK